MASKRLRKGQCYRMLERAYTRKSKYRKHNFMKAVPQHKIVKFNMGDAKGTFKYQVDLYSKSTLQLRSNAIESARRVINRKLTKSLGNQEFYLVVRIYPHHAQRENKQMGGQHADRVQTGMGHPFGKIINVAAIIKEGKELFTAYVDDKGLPIVKDAFKCSAAKLPCKIGLEITKLKD